MTSWRRRDRHGRGLRGRLLPPVAVPGPSGTEVAVPGWRSRRDRFDDLVADAFDDLLPRWGEQLREVELAVEDVPDSRPGALGEHLVADETEGGPVPLGHVAAGTPAQLVVFRRPLEARADDLADLAELVHEVVVDLVAQLLGLDPDEVDPPGDD